MSRNPLLLIHETVGLFRTHLKTILHTLISLVLITSCNSQTPKLAIYKVGSINMQGPATKREMAQALKITRNSMDDSIIVVFPSGGTQTEVILYKQVEYDTWKSQQMGSKPDALSIYNESVNDSTERGLSIDLTRLLDGNYVGEWVTCGLSAYAVIELNTKK